MIIFGIVLVVVIGAVVGVVVASSGGGSEGNDANESAATRDEDGADGGAGSSQDDNAAQPPAGTNFLPNIGFAFSGYDLLRGNPIATGFGGGVATSKFNILLRSLSTSSSFY